MECNIAVRLHVVIRIMYLCWYVPYNSLPTIAVNNDNEHPSSVTIGAIGIDVEEFSTLHDPILH